MIELASKKKFVNWLIQSVSLKKRESYWILNYLLNHEFLLDRVTFVENVLSTPRGLLVTDQSVSGSGLEMVNQGIVIDDPNKIFHDIRLNRKSPLFIGVSFDGMTLSKYYLDVLEENPYQPLDEEAEKEFRLALNSFIEEEERKFKLNILLEKINQALETGNKKEFQKLSKDYQRLKENESL